MELDKAVEELKGEVRQFQEESVKPIQERLASLEERGTAPNDEKVADLEKRLCEAEARSTEQLEKLAEQVRIAEVQRGTIAGSGAGSESKFRGELLPGDLEEMKRSLVQNRTIDSGLLTGTGDPGRLSLDTADSFIDYFVNEQSTLGICDVRRMNGPTGAIDRLNFAAEKIRLATEATGQAVSDSVTTARRNLTTTEIIWTEDISLTFLEDNIARGNVENQIATKLGQVFGTDLNSLGWRGDEAKTASDFLKTNNGWNALLEADTDVASVDLSGQTGTTAAETNLSTTLKTLPLKYRTISDLTFFAPAGFVQRYADHFAARATSMGDDVLVNGFPNMRYFGIPIVAETAMVTDNVHDGTGNTGNAESGAAALGAKLILSPRSNFVFGIQRDITVDTEWNPRKRVVEYTMSARIDYNHAFGGVVVIGHSLDAASL